MFLGHIGIGLASKRLVPGEPIVALVSLAMMQDLLAVPCILLAESSFDAVWATHSLLMSLVWAASAALLVWLFRHNLRIALVAGLLVLSHWIADFISWPMGFGRGLPLLLKGSLEVGLGLYNTTIGSLIGEGAGLLLVLIMVTQLRKYRAARQAVPPGR